MTTKTSKKLERKQLMSVFWRSFGLEWDWNYERQMNIGYCYCMLPVIKKLYDDPAEQEAAMKRHLEFFNTTPQLATLILGITAASTWRTPERWWSSFTGTGEQRCSTVRLT